MYHGLNETISRLRRKTATGPDQIPNKAFIEANKRTREIYRKTLNNLSAIQTFLEGYQEKYILRIYKGKCKKGKCSNE